MAQVFGVGIDELQKSLANSRYFYGLRRTDSGELYMVKADLLELEDGVQLNRPGNIDANYNNFSRGEDFFEGRDHSTERFIRILFMNSTNGTEETYFTM